ncbi:hypothetical protein GCM10011497_04440 [Elstera cyanobacteriorum]|uniref:hypothetical protein n=1 Tax=Elstera cyanobacteriorum TaxID=2022747 RepID=UPI00113FE605|nr:hypothetical protein [Elstera cyanobacteriorum]GFZ79378.1 hypothetical protein GCM10011497_04440 [Elstera cyanobacteriorum]
MTVDFSQTLSELKNIQNLLSNYPNKNQMISFQGVDFSIQDVSIFIEKTKDDIESVSINSINAAEFKMEELKLSVCFMKINKSFHLFRNNGINNTHNQISDLFESLHSIKQFSDKMIKTHKDYLFSKTNPDLESEKNRYEDFINEVNEILREIRENRVNITRILSDSEILSDKNREIHQIIQKSLLDIQGHEREVSTAKITTLSSASDAQSALSSIHKVIDDLNQSIIIKDNLFQEFNSIRDDVSILLENANKIGLARSFSQRKKDLFISSWLWLSMFVLGVGGLLALGIYYILPLLGVSSPDPTAVATRFLIGAPLVWLTWFGARQYGHNLRMREDYAFKEATAMAFVGYRNEMSQDADMLKLLQESAIRNFASSPLEAISKKDEVASPIHDLLEKSLSKLEPKQLVDAIITLTKKDK